MRRQLLGFALALLGLLVLGMAVGPAPTPAAAMPALQPSPRPTIDVPGSDIDYPDPPPMGRITGTVIDLRTGAPSAGKNVRVGESLVSSDSNGNYDIWVTKGEYPVSLALSEVEGVAAQNVTLATVWGNDTVVVHLFYIGPLQAPTPAATPEPAPTVAPPVAVEQPASLPVTGNELLDPQSVALGGLALLALGGALMLLPRRAPARVGAGVARVRRRRQSAEDLLRELLRRDP